MCINLHAVVSILSMVCLVTIYLSAYLLLFSFYGSRQSCTSAVCACLDKRKIAPMLRSTIFMQLFKTCLHTVTACLWCSWIEASLLALEDNPSDAQRAKEDDHPISLAGAIKRQPADDSSVGMWDYRSAQHA